MFLLWRAPHRPSLPPFSFLVFWRRNRSCHSRQLSWATKYRWLLSNAVDPHDHDVKPIIWRTRARNRGRRALSKHPSHHDDKNWYPANLLTRIFNIRICPRTRARTITNKREAFREFLEFIKLSYKVRKKETLTRKRWRMDGRPGSAEAWDCSPLTTKWPVT